MTDKKDIKRQRAELLGMPYGTAEKKLRKAIMYELAQQIGKNVCRWCNSAIDSPDDLSVVHVQDWQEDPDSFWDLTNIAFSHVSCAAQRGGKRQEEENMSRIDVRIEAENGQLLTGTKHKGKLYVAGKKNQRYNISVRNTTNKTLLVVPTVDGRNVLTGKVGSYDDSGHVIGPRDSYTFEGWRQDDDTVGAFRFGKKKEAYASQMGSPQHVGVIGIAVFEEFEPPKSIITIKEKEYIPYPVPAPWPARPVRPWVEPYRPVWYYEPTYTTRTVDHTGGASWTTDTVHFGGGGGGGGTFTSSVAPTMSETLSHGNTSQGSDVFIGAVQGIGTGFGEDLESSVVNVSFNRSTDNPLEVYEIRYDTKANLEKQGIKFTRPSQKRKKQREEGPSAFPKEPRGGVCVPPRHRVLYK